MRDFTTEQLTERWEAHNEITNLVGRLSFWEMLRDTDTIADHWCNEPNVPVLGLQNGYYRGRAAIDGYYLAVKKLDVIKAETAKTLNTDELKDKAIDDIRGIGALRALNFTTPVLELAGDGKTAKGLWYIIAGDVDFYSGTGPAAKNIWGRVGVDFIKEDDGWKLWHVVCAIDIDAPMGGDWIGTAGTADNHEGYERIASYAMPKPTVETDVYPAYTPKRQLLRFPRVPEPYGSFAETFSYGIE
jgi:hypothetical protein